MLSLQNKLRAQEEEARKLADDHKADTVELECERGSAFARARMAA